MKQSYSSAQEKIKTNESDLQKQSWFWFLVMSYFVMLDPPYNSCRLSSLIQSSVAEVGSSGGSWSPAISLAS